ncbi:sugar phosphate isomerase/epimerase family protein [Flavitalea antarctica]
MHTITTKPWDIVTAVQKFAASGIGGITIWRDALLNRNLAEVRSMIADAGIEVVSLCRGGFFPSVDPQQRKLAIEDNLRAIDQANAIGAPMMVMVCGADPRQSLEDSRKQIAEGIMACLDHASAAGVQLTIEPLHPMYAGDRSAINTLGQANDMAEEIDSPWVGIALDVYHLWWDSDLERQIERCGTNGNLSAFHICDWKTPTLDMLNDRGLMGEGCIDIKKIRGWVERAGFKGFHEAEIFSNIYWQQDQDLYLGKIKDAYLKYS